MSSLKTPVLIVGGGGCGLAMSMFLSNLGIPSILVERHAKPSPMPKARYLNQRSMEIFRQHGLADSIYAHSFPLQNMSKTRWCTSLGGNGIYDQKTLFEIETFGGGSLAPQYKANSPCQSTIYPQVRLEPLMSEAARASPLATLLYEHDFTDLEQHAGGVTATITDRSSGRVMSIQAQYLVAADAGKSVGPVVGAKLSGTPELIDMVTMYFRADMSSHLNDDETFAYWFANPGGDTGSWGSGVLGKLGPGHYDRHSEEWMFHFSFKSDDPARFDEAQLVPRMRKLMKLPDLQPQILAVGHWMVQGVLADRYRFGRVLLAGDAAHRHTPTTGLGLNSAIQDAHNLAWKLGHVLNGGSSDALIDTYESERRPAAQRNVDWALFTFSNHQLTGAAIGLVPGDAERSEANFKALLAETPDGEARRHRFDAVMRLHATEYQAIDLEIGVRYEVGALVPDGTPPLSLDPTGRHFHPSTRPGNRLPHAWLMRDGQRISTLDLVPQDRLVMLTGRADSPWATMMVQAAARFGLCVNVIAILDPVSSGAGEAGVVIDADHRWRDIRETGDDGGLLVRPDQIIAWRAYDHRNASADILAGVLQSVLRLGSPLQ